MQHTHVCNHFTINDILIVTLDFQVSKLIHRSRTKLINGTLCNSKNIKMFKTIDIIVNDILIITIDFHVCRLRLT
jgi:hypothetical protein